MSDTTLSENTTKLSILSLVVDSYRMVFGNLGAMVRILWAPMLFMSALSYRYQTETLPDLMKAPELAVEPSLSEDPAVMQAQMEAQMEALQAQLDVFLDPIFLIFTVVSWLVMCGVFVSLHRFVMIGDRPSLLGFTVGKREFRYLGYLIAIGLVMILGMTVFMLGFTVFQVLISVVLGDGGAMMGILSFASMVAMMVFMFVAYIRFGFVLPAIALDREGGVRHRLGAAWHLAKGNTFRMFVALFVASLPSVIASAVWSFYFLDSIMQGDISTIGLTTNLIIMGIVGWATYAVLISLYSIAYQSLSQATE